MDALYEATVLLSATLLAVLIPVFVFAVSLLGRAIEKSLEDRQKAEESTRQQLSKARDEAKAELEKAQKPEDMQRIKRRISELEKSLSKSEKELKRIQKAPELLTVKQGVLLPGLSFLGALSLGAIAKLLSRITETWTAMDWLAVALWIIALVVIALGAYRLYNSLRMVQNVAITSEAAYYKRTMEAFKVALAEHEEAKRPKLELKFRDQQPPFHFKKGSEVNINYRLTLAAGDVARQVEVWFLTPQDFGLPGRSTWAQSADHSVFPSYLTTAVKEEADLKRGISYSRTLKLKTPYKEGHYTCGYSLYCEGFQNLNNKFEIVIE